MARTELMFAPDVVVDRALVQIQAAKPKDPALLDAFLHATTLALLAPQHRPATAALAVTGQIVAGTSWAGYRTGRARVASMAATYLNWLAPPATWTFESGCLVGTQRALRWQAADTGDYVVDVLTGCADRHGIEAAFAADADLAAVRVLRLEQPGRSVAYTADHAPRPLAGGEWDLAEAWS